MEPLRPEQDDRIKDALPVQRGYVEVESIVFLAVEMTPIMFQLSPGQAHGRGADFKIKID